MKFPVQVGDAYFSDQFRYKVHLSEEMITHKEYYKKLEEALKEEGLTFLEYIKSYKKAIQLRDIFNNKKKEEYESDVTRWENGEYDERELEKIEEIQKMCEEDNEKYISMGLVDKDLNILEDNVMEHINKKREKQLELCHSTNSPYFYISSCFKCNHDPYKIKVQTITVFDKKIKRVTEPITLEDASNRLTTGCPHCSASFVD